MIEQLESATIKVKLGDNFTFSFVKVSCNEHNMICEIRQLIYDFEKGIIIDVSWQPIQEIYKELIFRAKNNDMKRGQVFEERTIASFAAEVLPSNLKREMYEGSIRKGLFIFNTFEEIKQFYEEIQFKAQILKL
jgi:hypothetical protein